VAPHAACAPRSMSASAGRACMHARMRPLSRARPRWARPCLQACRSGSGVCMQPRCPRTPPQGRTRSVAWCRMRAHASMREEPRPPTGASQPAFNAALNAPLRRASQATAPCAHALPSPPLSRHSRAHPNTRPAHTHTHTHTGSPNTHSRFRALQQAAADRHAQRGEWMGCTPPPRVCALEHTS